MGNLSASENLLHPPAANGNHGSLHSIMEEEQAPKSESLEGEFSDFLSILDQPEFSDVTLLVEGGRKIHCHQVILASRSTYFEATFTNDFSEKECGTVDLSRSNISYEQLMRLLRHIYSDSAKIDSKAIFDIVQLADRYDVQSIKRRCEQIFAQHISIDSVCQIFKYACQFNCERLKETCLNFTEENHQEVLQSPGFEELDREELL